MGETCGALTGAIMGVCCVVGREKFEDQEQYGKAMEEANKVYRLFRDEVGHTHCEGIHKIRYGKVYHMINPDEREAFHDDGGHSRTGCPEVCGIAGRIAAEVILDLQKGSSKRKFAKTRILKNSK